MKKLRKGEGSRKAGGRRRREEQRQRREERRRRRRKGWGTKVISICEGIREGGEGGGIRRDVGRWRMKGDGSISRDEEKGSVII